MVTGGGGEVERLEDLGVRKLAYEVNGRSDGRYVLMVVQAEPLLPAEICRQMRIDERIVRHLCIVETKRMRRAAELKRLREEELAAAAAQAAQLGPEEAEPEAEAPPAGFEDEPQPEDEPVPDDETDEGEAEDEEEESQAGNTAS
jgi:small subunit ribosomal protein S6